MPDFLTIGGDAQRALESVSVPSYAIDSSGVIRWLNPAAKRLVGDVRGRHFTSVVAPEDVRRSRDAFSRKMLGAVPVTDTEVALMTTEGRRVSVEVSSVPLVSGGHVVGVFGQLVRQHDEPAREPIPHLTPRQEEVLQMLEHGSSTKQIAQELHLSTETVRNHIRHVLRALNVNSRLEAVAVARHGAWVVDRPQVV
jgi:PAS domain S-box-containing protein